jgi:hypothetical protein
LGEAARLVMDRQRLSRDEDMMAKNSTMPNEPTAHEMTHHVRDYSRFTTMVKWGGLAAFIIAFIVVVFVL